MNSVVLLKCGARAKERDTPFFGPVTLASHRGIDLTDWRIDDASRDELLEGAREAVAAVRLRAVEVAGLETCCYRGDAAEHRQAARGGCAGTGKQQKAGRLTRNESVQVEA